MKRKEAVILDFFEECLNKKNFEDGIFDAFAKETVLDGLLGKSIGPAPVKKILSHWVEAIPDYHIKVTKMDRYENTIMTSAVVSGTHQKAYSDPSKKKDATRSDFCSQFELFTPKNKKFVIPTDFVAIVSNNKIQRYMLTRFDLSTLRNQIGMELPSFGQARQNDERLLIGRLEKLGNPKLTSKELSCLAFNLSGFSAKQIGCILGNSHRTIETHLRHGFQKVGCFTRLDCLEKMVANETLPVWHDLCCVLFKKYKNSVNFR